MIRIDFGSVCQATKGELGLAYRERIAPKLDEHFGRRALLRFFSSLLVFGKHCENLAVTVSDTLRYLQDSLGSTDPGLLQIHSREQAGQSEFELTNSMLIESDLGSLTKVPLEA